MAWSFGDGFDLYAAPADALNGYWDSAPALPSNIVTGRFSGSRAIQWIASNNNSSYTKNSGANDTVHHIVLAFQQTSSIAGTNLGGAFTLYDGITAQCSVVFRSDGAIVLTSGAANGTVLDTYTGAFTVANTWYAFEIEIVVNNTTGSWAVRKNGNTSNDHALGSLNTRGGTANNYANKLAMTTGPQGTTPVHYCDDLFWRSDASSVAWMGDIRCYTRMPASDQSVQFSRTPTSYVQTPFVLNNSVAVTNGAAIYTPFTAAYDGTIGTASISMGTGYTGNLKCSIFASSGSAPTTVLGSASVLVNPATGSNTITFGTPVAVTKGTQYWIGFDSDTTSGQFNMRTVSGGFSSTTPYASFPVASPSSAGGNSVVICSLTITVTTNNCVVNEAQQDAATSYVYDSTPGHADFYNIGAIASTPVSTIMVTTRGYMQKSDAGTRTAAVQLKSGGATVASPTLTLTTSGWQWAWRQDLVDPNTSAAWTAAAVNNVTIGPTVIA